MRPGASPDARPPDWVEHAFADVTEPAGAAISNGQAREQYRRLAREQTGLRRVATLVAEGATPADVFAAIAREVALVLKLPVAVMYRYEPDGTATVVASVGASTLPVGTNWPLDGASLASLVRKTGRPARVENYSDNPRTANEAASRAGVARAVGAPIVVDGELWGFVGAGASQHRSLPAHAERHLSRFTTLLASAISYTQARENLSLVAEQHAALVRLAALVADGAEPRMVFDAVCEEAGRVLRASTVNLARFTSEGFSVTTAAWSLRGPPVPLGTRSRLDGDPMATMVRDTATPGRSDSCKAPSRELRDHVRRLGVRSAVAAPVNVDGRVWGALIAARDGPDPLPAGVEQRLATFAEVIVAGLSSAAARSELAASRVRIVESADEQRRRIVRDLHDGAQSRLLHAVIALERVKASGDLAPDVRPLVEEGLTHARSAIDELRELAHGIHPAILTNTGLAAAVAALADRAPLPVEIAIPQERYPASVESAAYFVAAEALTNVAKYARASRARITATRTSAGLRLVVEDDGVGGAKRAPGRGLAGLGDRLAALNGVLAIDSRPGGGTRIRAEIPLPAPA